MNVGRRLITLAAVSILLTTACSTETPPSGGTPSSEPSATSAGSAWDSLHRPLNLPTVAAGSTCPTTTSQLATKVDPSFDPGGTPEAYRAFGAGPAYPIIYGLNSSHSAVSLARIEQIGGVYPDKVLWLIDPGYSGPVLVRGRRLDGTEPLTFVEGSFSPANSSWNEAELRLPAANSTDSGTWREPGSGFLVPSIGCFAIQVDSVAVSQVIVFEVVAS